MGDLVVDGARVNARKVVVGGVPDTNPSFFLAPFFVVDTSRDYTGNESAAGITWRSSDGRMLANSGGDLTSWQTPTNYFRDDIPTPVTTSQILLESVELIGTLNTSGTANLQAWIDTGVWRPINSTNFVFLNRPPTGGFATITLRAFYRETGQTDPQGSHLITYNWQR